MKSTLPEFWIARRKLRPLRQATEAMTVAIRTFLQQNANREGDCLTIPDSSATQRVSASPATTGARTMTAWTQDLIYAGNEFSSSRQSRYRRDTFLAASHGPGGAGGALRPDTGVLIPTTALAAGELHAQPASYYPKRKPGWQKNAAVAAYITRRDGVQRTRRVCGLSFSLRFPLYRSAAETAVYS